MKNKTVFAFIASVMSAVTIMLPPMQVMAAAQDAAPTEYISEVRIGVGKNMFDASNSLEGYTILRNGEKAVDLNENAGGGFGSKGDRVVLIGYKTTTDRKEAITDLALMNMKGGYSVSDYEALMEKQMKEQIIPFVENFQAAIDEYRENYNSDIEANKQRAKYIHDILDKFIDDDTGKGLGELLLNETKFEMGDAAYNKLSDAEKKNHADILTILAQSNGQATLMMENLLTRAADTEEDTWLDRFAATTYQDIIDSADMPPTEAKDEIAKLYDDDAQKILDMWDPLYEHLENYDNALKIIEEKDKEEYKKYEEIVKNFDIKNATEEQIKEYTEANAKILVHTELVADAYNDIAIKEYLESIEYNDGTLLDFFSRPYEDVYEDITEIYPLVASLSDGQRAGLDFITLADLIMIGATTAEGYKDAALDELKEMSIYDGVDRGIYEKGGVALTSDAERIKKGNIQDPEKEKGLSVWTYAMIGLTGASAVAFTGSVIGKIVNVSRISSLNKSIENARNAYNFAAAKKFLYQDNSIPPAQDYLYNDCEAIDWTIEKNKALDDLKYYNAEGKMEILQARSSLCNKLMAGFGIAMIILAGITTYLAYRDLAEYYKTDFTPIPKYMVDVEDITAYNAKGEMEVIKNQSAYYKAVECNRTDKDEKYKNIGTFADMNGDVGKQWLALYAVKNEAMAPILADSLLAVVGNTDLPSGYTTGIHMFGSDSAFNLNDSKYVWNANASKVFVYFNVDDKPASTSTGTNADTTTDNASVTGSVFTTGSLFLSGGIGLLLGAGIVALVFIAMKPKKKEEKAE